MNNTSVARSVNVSPAVAPVAVENIVSVAMAAEAAMREWLEESAAPAEIYALLDRLQPLHQAEVMARPAGPVTALQRSMAADTVREVKAAISRHALRCTGALD